MDNQPEAGQAAFDVAALYCFTPMPELAALKAELLALAGQCGLCGTLLIAPEGFNGTLGGPRAGLDRFIARLRGLAGNHAIELKYSAASQKPFKRLKVRIKKEIVTLGVDGIDPLKTVGTYVAPEDWNALISAPDVVVVDTRNTYETAIGTFKGAVDPQTRTFRAFPEWVEGNRALFEGKRVAMYCTGGIRCEKATAYMKGLGFDRVFHLKGGILKYLEDVPPDESLWDGECFVFDERVALGHGLEEAELVPCATCGTPVTAAIAQGSAATCPDCAREPLRRERDLTATQKDKAHDRPQETAG